MGHWLNWSHSIYISRPSKWWKMTHNATRCWQNVCNYLLCDKLFSVSSFYFNFKWIFVALVSMSSQVHRYCPCISNAARKKRRKKMHVKHLNRFIFQIKILLVPMYVCECVHSKLLSFKLNEHFTCRRYIHMYTYVHIFRTHACMYGFAVLVWNRYGRH